MQVDDQKWRDILAETEAGIEASRLPDAARPALTFEEALQLMRDRPDTYLLLDHHDRSENRGPLFKNRKKTTRRTCRSRCGRRMPTTSAATTPPPATHRTEGARR